MRWVASGCDAAGLGCGRPRPGRAACERPSYEAARGPRLHSAPTPGGSARVREPPTVLRRRRGRAGRVVLIVIHQQRLVGGARREASVDALAAGGLQYEAVAFRQRRARRDERREGVFSEAVEAWRAGRRRERGGGGGGRDRARWSAWGRGRAGRRGRGAGGGLLLLLLLLLQGMSAMRPRAVGWAADPAFSGQELASHPAKSTQHLSDQTTGHSGGPAAPM